jgi:cbb3-type cytochrome oxidase maturation protein
MSTMFILILASLTVAIGFLIAFLWAVRTGQFEDKYTPKVRILFEDKKIKPGVDSISSIHKET